MDIGGQKSEARAPCLGQVGRRRPYGECISQQIWRQRSTVSGTGDVRYQKVLTTEEVLEDH